MRVAGAYYWHGAVVVKAGGVGREGPFSESTRTQMQVREIITPMVGWVLFCML